MSTKAQVNKNVNQKNTQAKGQQPQKQEKITTTKNFNVSKLKVVDIDPENEFCKAQMIGWVRYEEETLHIQTPEFKLSQYGASTLSEFIKTEKDRQTIKLPLDDQPGCVELKEKMFNHIDNKMKKEKTTIFPPEILEGMEEDGIVFTYTPIVRDPKKETAMERKAVEKKWKDAGKDITKRTQKCQFWKAKLNTKRDNQDELDIVCWVKDPDWTPSYEGEVERARKVCPKNVDELLEVMPWGSTVRFVVTFNKFYADKTPKDDKLKYGLGMKIKQIMTTPRKSADGPAKSLPEYAFVDADEEEEKKEEVEEVEEEDGEEEDGEEEEEDGEEEEETPEPEPEPVKPEPKPTGKKQPAKPSGKGKQ